MFIVAIIACASVEFTSCQLYTNSKRVFVTEEDCKKEIEVLGPYLPGVVTYSYCLKTPGTAL